MTHTGQICVYSTLPSWLPWVRFVPIFSHQNYLMWLLTHIKILVAMMQWGVCSCPPPACLHVACVVQQKDARQWFAELSVDMDKVRILLRKTFAFKYSILDNMNITLTRIKQISHGDIFRWTEVNGNDKNVIFSSFKKKKELYRETNSIHNILCCHKITVRNQEFQSYQLYLENKITKVLYSKQKHTN